MKKFIFVTGGVVSSLGKGIFAASLGKLLKARGYKVGIQKLDPYINIDPGTLNPFEHGECFVTTDGAETDLDLGHYERFLDIQTTQINNLTCGKVYQTVIEQERDGYFVGKTVQVIPHITDEIKKNIRNFLTSSQNDISIIELGGTVGDIESLPFIESVRQVIWEEAEHVCISIHLTLLPYIDSSQELKTKPTQHSVKKLLELGIVPDLIVCRTQKSIVKEIKNKIALFCNVTREAVFEAIDADSIYKVPINLYKEGIDEFILNKLDLPKKNIDLSSWNNFLKLYSNSTKKINIALVGKYTQLKDAYLSIWESLNIASISNRVSVEIHFISSDEIEENIKRLDAFQGIIVLPGFGSRGFEGKIEACRYAREKKIPFLGICLGMQAAMVEFARNVLQLKEANSTEIKPQTPDPVIDLMEQQKEVTKLGGTMRLGSYTCQLAQDSKVYRCYGQKTIQERHRHRWEFNNKYMDAFKQAGMKVAGIHKETQLVEIIELASHPFYVGTQFHPEYQSRVEKPHPLFLEFVRQALNQR